MAAAHLQLNVMTKAERDAIAAPVDGMAIWNSTDNHVNVYDGTRWRSVTQPIKSYSFKSRTGSSGTSYLGGFYFGPSTDANLSNASPTITLGAANVPYAAHTFAVAGGAGTTDGSDLVLTVTGTSIDDAGTRTTSDSEVIVADCTAASLNEYFEGKKWIGQVTYTLSSTAGTTFSFDFNLGFAKYDDFGNHSMVLTDFEAVGLSQNADAGFNIELLHHKTTGWTYAASGFMPGPAALLDMSTVHGAESDLDTNEPFAFKRAGLATAIAGNDSEGVLIRVTTSVANSIQFLDCHVAAEI